MRRLTADQQSPTATVARAAIGLSSSGSLLVRSLQSAFSSSDTAAWQLAFVQLDPVFPFYAQKLPRIGEGSLAEFMLSLGALNAFEVGGDGESVGWTQNGVNVNMATRAG